MVVCCYSPAQSPPRCTKIKCYSPHINQNYISRYSTIITGRPARSAAMPVLILLNGPKWVFRPAGATCCPDKRGHLPRAKFHVYLHENVGIQPQNCQNFEFWPEICTSGATRLQYFYKILSICTRL